LSNKMAFIDLHSVNPVYWQIFNSVSHI